MTQDDRFDVVKERLRKLLTLARQGVGGEAINAERMMNSLMKKYALTLEDFDPGQEEQVSRHCFAYADTFSRRLLKQIIGKVLNTCEISFYTQKGVKAIHIDCTKTQALEISLMYDVYLRAWKKDLANCERAFYHKHDIFPSEQPDTPPEPLSLEDAEALRRMMRSITPVNYRKALEERPSA